VVGTQLPPIDLVVDTQLTAPSIQNDSVAGTEDTLIQACLPQREVA
jgi:hypothetical protein